MENRRSKRTLAKRYEEPTISMVNTQTGANNRLKRASATPVAVASAPTVSNAPERQGKYISPGRPRASSPRNRASPPSAHYSPPVRRSSRPRSIVSAIPSTATVNLPSTIKEVVEQPTNSPQSSVSTHTITVSKDLSTKNRLPEKSTTASVYSTYSTSTEKTLDVHQSSLATEVDSSKLSDYLRRSASKSVLSTVSETREGTHTPTTNTDVAESRYSRSESRSVYDDDSKAEFSAIADDDNEDNFTSFHTTRGASIPYAQQRRPIICRSFEAPSEFGGVFGAIALMIIAPCLIYYLQWTCSNLSCTLKSLNFEGVTLKYITDTMFQKDAVTAFITFYLSMFVLSALCFGKTVRLTSDRNYVTYKFNALPIAIIVTIGAVVAEYNQYAVVNFVIKHYSHFCLFGLINAFIMAQWCYWSANRIQTYGVQSNSYGKSGNYFIDYALGRQLNPKWLGFVDYKQVYYRISLIATLIFAECFLYKSMQIPSLPEKNETTAGIVNLINFYITNIEFNYASFLTAGSLLVYISDAITFEHHLASSFELHGEGFGCLLLLRYAATPFLLSSVAKYFFDHRIPIKCNYAAYVAIGLLIAGLILKRLSNAVKYKYRINPTNLMFANVETVHTFQGRRLLLGKLWGKIRQPNYAGDILALCGLILPILLNFAWAPLISVMTLMIILLHRAVRVNVRNLSQYHSSWVRYCSQVQYFVLPKVY